MSRASSAPPADNCGGAALKCACSKWLTSIAILRHQAASQVAPCPECFLWRSVKKRTNQHWTRAYGAARIHRRNAPGKCSISCHSSSLRPLKRDRIALRRDEIGVYSTSLPGVKFPDTSRRSMWMVREQLQWAEVPSSDLSSRSPLCGGRFGHLCHTTGMDLHRPIRWWRNPLH